LNTLRSENIDPTWAVFRDIPEKRVVELKISHGAGASKLQFVAAFWLSHVLLVTCHHGVVVDGETIGDHDSYSIRGLTNSDWRALDGARLLWSDAKLDLAIILAPGSSGIDDDQIGFYPWRLLLGSVTYRGTSIGFPSASRSDRAHEKGVVEPRRATGLITPASLARSGLLRLDVESGGIREKADWEGFSGAPIFTDGVLVGIVQRVDLRMTRPELHGESIERLLTHPELICRLREESIAVRPAQRIALDEYSQAVLDELLGRNADAIVPFGGRSPRIQALSAWVNRQDTARIGLLEAKAGMGKSTLMAHLVRHLAMQATQPYVVYAPVRRDRGDNVPSTLLTRVRDQIADLFGFEKSANARSDLQHFACEPAPMGSELVLIVDGLDELELGTQRALFPPASTLSWWKVIVSTRPPGSPRPWSAVISGDSGSHAIEKLELGAPSRYWIREALLSVPALPAQWTICPELITALNAKCKGDDPFLLAGWLKVLHSWSESRGIIPKPEEAAHYLNSQMDEEQALFEQWGEELLDATAHARGAAETMLGLCASADLDPLDAGDLAGAGHEVFPTGSLSVERAAHSLRRFLHYTEGVGYTLQHARYTAPARSKVGEKFYRQCADRLSAYCKERLAVFAEVQGDPSRLLLAVREAPFPARFALRQQLRSGCSRDQVLDSVTRAFLRASLLLTGFPSELITDLNAIVKKSVENGETLNACRAVLALSTTTSVLLSTTSSACIAFGVRNGLIDRAKAIEIIDHLRELPTDHGHAKSQRDGPGPDAIRLWLGKLQIVRTRADQSEIADFIRTIIRELANLERRHASALRRQDPNSSRIYHFLKELSYSIKEPASADMFAILVENVNDSPASTFRTNYSSYSDLLEVAFSHGSTELRRHIIEGVSDPHSELIYSVDALASQATAEERRLLIDQCDALDNVYASLRILVCMHNHGLSLARKLHVRVLDIVTGYPPSDEWEFDTIVELDALKDRALFRRLVQKLNLETQQERKVLGRVAALHPVRDLLVGNANLEDKLLELITYDVTHYWEWEEILEHPARRGTIEDHERILAFLAARGGDSRASDILHRFLRILAREGRSFDLVATYAGRLAPKEGWEVLSISMCEGARKGSLDPHAERCFFDVSLTFPPLPKSTDEYREHFYDALIERDFLPAVGHVLRCARVLGFPGDEPARASILLKLVERVDETHYERIVPYLWTFEHVKSIAEPLGVMAPKMNGTLTSQVMTHLNEVVSGNAATKEEGVEGAAASAAAVYFGFDIRQTFILTVLEHGRGDAVEALLMKLLPEFDLNSEQRVRQIFAAGLASGTVSAEQALALLPSIPTQDAKAVAIEEIASACPDVDAELLFRLSSGLTAGAVATALAAIARLALNDGWRIAEREVSRLYGEERFIVKVGLASKDTAALKDAIERIGPEIKTERGDAALAQLVALVSDLDQPGLKPKLASCFQSKSGTVATARYAKTFAACANRAGAQDADWLLAASLDLDPGHIMGALRTLATKAPREHIYVFLEHASRLPFKTRPTYLDAIFDAAKAAGLARRCLELIEKSYLVIIEDLRMRGGRCQSDIYLDPNEDLYENASEYHGIGQNMACLLAGLGPKLDEPLRLHTYDFIEKHAAGYVHLFLIRNFMLLPQALRTKLTEHYLSLRGVSCEVSEFSWSVMKFFEENVTFTTEGFPVSQHPKGWPSSRSELQTAAHVGPKPEELLSIDATVRSVGIREVGRFIDSLKDDECGKLLGTLIEVSSWP
jgi:hypothetical protein